MNMPFIMQMRPLFGTEEKRAICEYMDEDGFITEFKRTELFEHMIAEYTGAKHCVVVNNGTVSLTLAAMAAGVQTGDEVIVPNYTMIATPNSVKMFGAVPVFVDVDPESLCLDIEKVKEALTPKTKAIILVSANGRYPKTGIKPFEELAKDKNLLLIEDAAQSLGSFYPDGRHIGRAGLIGSFSFSAPKIISTGQGGALITDNDEIGKKLRLLKDFGRTGGGIDIHDSIGYNFKFTELQACIGIEQMKKLNDRVKRKKEIWQKYSEKLKHVIEIQLFNHDLQNTCPWFIDAVAVKRNELATYLKSNNIGTRFMYPPINKQIAYNTNGFFPISNKIGDEGIWLPSYVQLKSSEIDYICEKIIDFYKINK
jgi:perosamine synthetase